MTPETRKELYDCNVHGMIDDIFKNFKGNNEMDYINKSIAYILKYGLDRRIPKQSLQELIYTCKNQVATMVVQKQLAANPNDLTNMQSKKYDLALKFFFNDPVGFIQAKLEDDEFYESIKPKESEELKGFAYKGYIKNLDKNRDKFIKLFKDEQDYKLEFKVHGRYKDKYTAFENGRTLTYDTLKAIESKIPESNHSIAKAFEKQKPSTWERRLGRTSKEYRAFKRTYNAYKDNTRKGYGDDKALEDAAIRYLHHKFPKLKEGEFPTAEQIAKLKGAGKERAAFCLKVVEAVRETRTNQAQIKKMIGAVKELNLGEVKPEYLKANAVLKEVIKEEKTATKSAKAEEKVSPRRGALKSTRRNNRTVSSERKIKLNLGDSKAPERTKTTGGPKNVKRHPKRIEPEEKKVVEEKPKVEVKVVKQAIDTKEFQANLKNDLEDPTLAATKVELSEKAIEVPEVQATEIKE